MIPVFLLRKSVIPYNQITSSSYFYFFLCPQNHVLEPLLQTEMRSGFTHSACVSHVTSQHSWISSLPPGPLACPCLPPPAHFCLPGRPRSFLFPARIICFPRYNLPHIAQNRNLPRAELGVTLLLFQHWDHNLHKLGTSHRPSVMGRLRWTVNLPLL